MAKAIDISKVESVKRDIHSDLIVSMSGVTNKHLQDLDVNIIRGLENEDEIVVFDGHSHVATRYAYDKTSRTSLGKGISRILKVTNDISYVPDNIQNYRESIISSMAGASSQGISTVKIEKRLRIMAAAYGNQVIYNFFHGDKSRAANHFYGLYDGILVKLQKDMEDGYIAASKGNFVSLDGFDCTTATAKQCYEVYVYFFQKLNGTLADDAVVYTTPQFFDKIVRGYAETFVGAQLDIIKGVDKNVFVSHETQGVVLKKTKLLGTGTGFIATAKGNLDYATDLTGNEDPSDAYMSITADQADPLNSILIGMQCASGTRVQDFNEVKLCITELNFVAPVQKENPTLEMKDVDPIDLAMQVAALREQLENMSNSNSGSDAGNGNSGTDGGNGGGGEETPTYTPVVDTTGKNPSTEGWYESDGDGGYVLTDDETPQQGTTYYTKD